MGRLLLFLAHLKNDGQRLELSEEVPRQAVSSLLRRQESSIFKAFLDSRLPGSCRDPEFSWPSISFNIARQQ